jgi:hypothetical protein
MPNSETFETPELQINVGQSGITTMTIPNDVLCELFALFVNTKDAEMGSGFFKKKDNYRAIQEAREYAVMLDKLEHDELGY